MFGIIDEATITEFFLSYAYSPNIIYWGVVTFMTLSSLGVPIPEEVVLVSCGFIGYMVNHPEIYPPPYPGAMGVNVTFLMWLCFISVLLSDCLVFLIGRFFGYKIFRTKLFQKKVGDQRLEQINSWYYRYGIWVSFLFRFTPGLRFPGHMSCGMLGLPLWKFFLVDALAAMISVPTQVYLVATYGEVILRHLKEFKFIIASLLLVGLVFFLVRKWMTKKKNKNEVSV